MSEAFDLEEELKSLAEAEGAKSDEDESVSKGDGDDAGEPAGSADGSGAGDDAIDPREQLTAILAENPHLATELAARYGVPVSGQDGASESSSDDLKIDLLDPDAAPKLIDAIVGKIESRSEEKVARVDAANEFLAEFEKYEPDAPDDFKAELRKELLKYDAKNLRDPQKRLGGIAAARGQLAMARSMGHYKAGKAGAGGPKDGEPNPAVARTSSGGVAVEKSVADGVDRLAQMLGLSDDKEFRAAAAAAVAKAS